MVEKRDDAAEPRTKHGTSVLAWLAAIVLLALAFGYFVVKPVGERVVEEATARVGAIAENALAKLAAVLQDLHRTATVRVEQSDAAQAMVGEPVRCASFEKTNWLEAADPQELEFEFEFTGPEGAGTAHVVAAGDDDTLRIQSIELTGPDGETRQLAEP